MNFNSVIFQMFNGFDLGVKVKMVRFSVFLVLAALLSSCKSVPQIPIPQEIFTQSAQSLQERTFVMMNNRRATSMPFYAPEHWESAEEAYNEGVELLQKNKPDADIKEQFLIAQNTFKVMEDIKNSILGDSLEIADYFKFLQKIEANKAYPEDYALLIDVFKTYIEQMENQQALKAQPIKSQLLKNMRDLEVKTIIYQMTSSAELDIKLSADMGAESLAELSFVSAKNSLANAKKIITEDPRQEQVINEASLMAFVEASHVKAVMTEELTLIKELNLKADKKTLEVLILRYETILTNIASILGAPSLRHLPVTDQAKIISDSAIAVKSRVQKTFEPPKFINKVYPPSKVAENKLELPVEFSN